MQLPGAEFGAFRWGYTVDPPLPGLTDEAVDHPRPAAARISPGAMDLLYALDDRAQADTLDPAVDRAGRPAARRRHDLGQQRHGVRSVPHAAAGAHRRDRSPTSRPVSAHRVGSARRRRTCRRWRCSTRPRLAEARDRARRSRRSSSSASTIRWRWSAPPSRASCWQAAATGSSTPPAAGLLDGDEAVLYAADLARATTDLDDADLVIVTDSNRDRAAPVARHAGRRWGSPRPAGPAPMCCNPTPPTNDCRCSPDDSAAHQTTAAVDGVSTCGQPAMASRSPIGRRTARRWPSTAIPPPHGWSPIGPTRSGSASRCRGDVSQLSLLQSQQPGRVADDLVGADRLRQRRDRRSSTSTSVRWPVPAQPIDVPAGATFARITILGRQRAARGTDPRPVRRRVCGARARRAPRGRQPARSDASTRRGRYSASPSC